MLKKIVLYSLIVLSLGGFAQNKISSNQVEDAFQLIFQNPSAAFKKLKVLEAQTKTQKDSLHSVVLSHIGVYYAVTSDLTKAGLYFDKSITSAVKGSKTQVNALKNRAIIYKKQGHYDQAIVLLKQALRSSKEKKYKDTEAMIYGEIGSCYSAQEDFETALNYFIKSIDTWERLDTKDEKKLAIEKQKLANLYFKMNNAKYALRLYQEIIPIFRAHADFYNLYLSQITEANIYLHLENPKLALQLLDGALLHLKKFDNKELILYAQERRAKALQSLQQIDQAIVAYQRALDYGLMHEQIRAVYTFIELGNLLVTSHKQQVLEKYVLVSEGVVFQKLLVLSTTEDAKRYYEVLLSFYQWKGANPDKILKYTQLRDEKEKELQAKYNVNKIREKQAEYRMKLAEHEATIASQKLELEKTKRIILSIVGILVLIVGTSLYYRAKLKQQLLQSNLATTTLAQQLAEKEYVKEKEISTLRLQKIKQQEQELLAQTLEKVEADKKIEKVVAELGADITPKKLKYLQTLQKGNTKYWENVLEKFHHINPTFNQILLDQYPQLTKGDRDFCSFVKLNLSNKEIAHLLQISPESVITKKYRIVKKLNLPKEVDFQHWLSEIRQF